MAFQRTARESRHDACTIEVGDADPTPQAIPLRSRGRGPRRADARRVRRRRDRPGRNWRSAAVFVLVDCRRGGERWWGSDHVVDWRRRRHGGRWRGRDDIVDWRRRRHGGGGGTDTDACETDTYCQGLYADYYWCWYPRFTPCIERVCHGALLPCASDSTCAASLGPAVCNACPTEGRCGWKCTADADCGPAATCDGEGHCLMQACQQPGDCPVNFDCTDRGDAALGKHCMRRTCTSASDCPGGYCVGLPHQGFCFEERGRCHDCT
jgi:hypothetical protein